MTLLNTLLITVLMGTTTAWTQEDVLRPQGKPIIPTGTTTVHRRSSGVTWRLGFEAGANLNFASQEINGSHARSPINVFRSGMGVSPLLGIYAEVQATNNISIGARFLYDKKSSSNTETNAEEDCTLLGTGNLSLAQIDSKYEASITYFTFNPLVRFSFADRFFVQFGPVLQFAATDMVTTYTRTVDAEEECRFIDGSPEGAMSAVGTVTDKADPSLRVGLDLGVGYRIPISPRIDLVPRIGYQMMLSPIAKGGESVDATRALTLGVVPITFGDAMLSSLQMSLSIWFTL